MKTRKIITKVKDERGQSSTEYMTLISVVVVAVVACSYAFVPTFQSGVYNLSHDVSQILSEHGSVKGGWGLAAATASGGGVGSTRKADTGLEAANAGNGGAIE